mgnify:CR=1 FL=1
MTDEIRLAWGAGFTTVADDGTELDTWFGWLGWGDFGESAPEEASGARSSRRSHTSARFPVRPPLRRICTFCSRATFSGGPAGNDTLVSLQAEATNLLLASNPYLGPGDSRRITLRGMPTAGDLPVCR